eukprot:366449-Chlamydomonas_euryale.AAC.14
MARRLATGAARPCAHLVRGWAGGGGRSVGCGALGTAQSFDAAPAAWKPHTGFKCHALARRLTPDVPGTAQRSFILEPTTSLCTRIQPCLTCSGCSDGRGKRASPAALFLRAATMTTCTCRPHTIHRSIHPSGLTRTSRHPPAATPAHACHPSPSGHPPATSSGTRQGITGTFRWQLGAAVGRLISHPCAPHPSGHPPHPLSVSECPPTDDWLKYGVETVIEEEPSPLASRLRSKSCAQPHLAIQPPHPITPSRLETEWKEAIEEERVTYRQLDRIILSAPERELDRLSAMQTATQRHIASFESVMDAEYTKAAVDAKMQVGTPGEALEGSRGDAQPACQTQRRSPQTGWFDLFRKEGRRAWTAHARAAEGSGSGRRGSGCVAGRFVVEPVGGQGSEVLADGTLRAAVNLPQSQSPNPCSLHTQCSKQLSNCPKFKPPPPLAPHKMLQVAIHLRQGPPPPPA